MTHGMAFVQNGFSVAADKMNTQIKTSHTTADRKGSTFTGKGSLRSITIYVNE